MQKRHSAEQIAQALRQAEAGTPIADLIRKLGVHENTFYLRKKKYGGLGTPEIRELRQLREDDMRPSDRASEILNVNRRACEILNVNRRAVRYRSVRVNVDLALRARIKAIAAVRIRYGQRRIHVLLRREGWMVNLKRVARLYREEGLAIRTKTPRRRRAAVVRETPAHPTATNQSWAMDFMHDVLADGSKIRLLTIVDNL